MDPYENDFEDEYDDYGIWDDYFETPETDNNYTTSTVSPIEEIKPKTKTQKGQ